MRGPGSSISSLRTVRTFLTRGTCSQTLLYLVNRAFEHPMADEERAADMMAGGIVQQGYQCGMLWGAALAAGAQAYRLFGTGARAEAMAIAASRRLVGSFRDLNNAVDCFDLTGIDRSTTTKQLVMFFLVKGGTVGCLRMAARYAPVALRDIKAALADEPAEVPAAPVSCAAMLARRMGASDMHAVMTAGFAGGIGLSGGACGALAAAIWIKAMNELEAGDGKVEFKSPGALAAIDRFLKCTDYVFECSRIVGREFEGVADHASHVCNGGCSRIMDVLCA